MNNKMIVTLLTTLLLFAPGSAFAPSTSTIQQVTSLNAETDRAKVYWANGKSQWEFEQSATYVVETEGSKKADIKKKAKKNGVDSQPYKYRRSVGKVSSLPFGRPRVQTKVTVKKKSAPLIAKTSVIDDLFAKVEGASAPNLSLPSLPLKIEFKKSFKKKSAAKPVAAKKGLPKLEFGKKSAATPVAAKKGLPKLEFGKKSAAKPVAAKKGLPKLEFGKKSAAKPVAAKKGLPKLAFGKKSAAKPVAAKKAAGPAFNNPFAKKAAPKAVAPPAKKSFLKGVLAKK